MRSKEKEKAELCEQIISVGKEILTYGRDYRFIPDNYQPVPDELPKIEFPCPSCGIQLNDDKFLFCPYCGKELKKNGQDI